MRDAATVVEYYETHVRQLQAALQHSQATCAMITQRWHEHSATHACKPRAAGSPSARASPFVRASPARSRTSTRVDTSAASVRSPASPARGAEEASRESIVPPPVSPPASSSHVERTPFSPAAASRIAALTEALARSESQAREQALAADMRLRELQSKHEHALALLSSVTTDARVQQDAISVLSSRLQEQASAPPSEPAALKEATTTIAHLTHERDALLTLLHESRYGHTLAMQRVTDLVEQVKRLTARWPSQ